MYQAYFSTVLPFSPKAITQISVGFTAISNRTNCNRINITPRIINNYGTSTGKYENFIAIMTIMVVYADKVEADVQQAEK